MSTIRSGKAQMETDASKETERESESDRQRQETEINHKRIGNTSCLWGRRQDTKWGTQQPRIFPPRRAGRGRGCPSHQDTSIQVNTKGALTHGHYRARAHVDEFLVMKAERAEAIRTLAVSLRPRPPVPSISTLSTAGMYFEIRATVR